MLNSRFVMVFELHHGLCDFLSNCLVNGKCWLTKISIDVANSRNVEGSRVSVQRIEWGNKNCF